MPVRALSWREAQAVECAACRVGFDVAAMHYAFKRMGTCGWELTQGEQTSTLYFGLLPGVRPRLRILAWHGAYRDRALLIPILRAVPRWGCVEARGTHREPTCTTIGVTSLHQWGFIPLGPAPDSWWRLDVGPLATLKAWWREQSREWRIPQSTLTDPVTSRNQEG